MIGNIVGQSLSDYLKEEIEIRQGTHGSGFDGDLRTPEQINYLNSRLAWVKMASSVEIVDKISFSKDAELSKANPFPKESQEDINVKLKSLNNHGEGTKKLSKIFDVGASVDQFMGIGLAKKAVLFNGLTEITDTETDNPGSTNYISRKGITTNNDSIWNNSAYGLGGLDFGIQPMPGITNVNIEHLNRGSIRKATVTLKAYNKKQFEILELLYLRLGYTMLLEWGNNMYLNKDKQKEDIITTLVDNYWFKSKENESHLQNLKKIEEYRKKYQGNYDGFFGRVSNFGWTFASDGSYDITIDLISLGDVIESLKVNVFDDNPRIFNIEGDDNIELDKISDFLFSLRDSTQVPSVTTKINLGNFSQPFTITTTIKDKINSLTNSKSSYTKEKIEEYKDEIVNLENNMLKYENPVKIMKSDLSKNKDYTGMDYNQYIRFGAFLNYLQEHIVLQVTNNGNTYFPIINVNNDKDLNVMYAEAKQFSINPKVCLVKNTFLSNEFTSDDVVKKNTIGLSINTLNQSLPRKYLHTTKGGVLYGNVMNIYLNFNFILTSLKSNLDSKGNLNIYKFLNSICKGINKSLGGINNLEPIVDELTNSITILDQSVVPGKNEFFSSEDPIIQVYGYNTTGSIVSNFVKNFNFQTEITPELSTMIAIGASANSEPVGEDSTAFSKWSLGLEDRFNRKTISPDSPDISPSDLKNTSTESLIKRNNELQFKSQPITGQGTVGFSTYTPNPNNAEKENLIREINIRKRVADKKTKIEVYNSSFNDYIYKAFNITSGKYLLIESKFISRGENILKNNLLQDINNEFEKTTNPGSSIGFIPFNLSITLDGISGFKIYNKLKTDSKFLPSNYPETLEFLIKQVNHSLSGNTWETQLETIAVPLSKAKSNNNLARKLKIANSNPLFTSPVRGMPLRPSGGGLGTYGAPRTREFTSDKGTLYTISVEGAHKGYDIQTIDKGKNIRQQYTQGTDIYAPISGIIDIKKTKDKKFLKFNIKGEGIYERYNVELAYIRSSVNSRSYVERGQLIGRSVNLKSATELIDGERNYRKGYSTDVLNHVHFSITKDGEHINPTPGVVITYEEPGIKP